MKQLKQFSDLIKEVFFPNTCVGCGEVIGENEYLCDYCYSLLDGIKADKQCFKCGHLKSECECKYTTSSYSGCVAPFHNENVARKLMYKYKLGRRLYISDFFAYKMASCVKTAFYDVEFHGVCYVPISVNSLRKRGFDQSYKIAKKMSELLGIPLITKGIVCNTINTKQHKTSGKERRENVKGAFKIKRKFVGNILLVDDIKTTGATLDECSKVLYKVGAQDVYCITALTTKYKDKKKGK